MKYSMKYFNYTSYSISCMKYSMEYLYFHRNHLSGAIPQSIGNLANIKQIYFQINKLSGYIPENICNIYSLNEDARIKLDKNKLCPPYPECISGSQLGITENNAINQDTTECELR